MRAVTLPRRACFDYPPNVDWGQGIKQAAEYVRNRHLDRVTMYPFSPLDNPQYYGLPRNLLPSEARDVFLGKRPNPGVYIISADGAARVCDGAAGVCRWLAELGGTEMGQLETGGVRRLRQRAAALFRMVRAV